MEDTHPWESSYPSGLGWRDPLPRMGALHELVARSAKRNPHGVALDFYGRTVTFAELLRLATAMASSLRELGVGPGSHVGLHLPSTPQFVVSFFAILMAGATVVNLSPHASAEELQAMLDDAEVKILITCGLPKAASDSASDIRKRVTMISVEAGEFADAAQATAIQRRFPKVDFLGEGARTIRFSDLVNGAPTDFAPHEVIDPEEEVALLQYTGGTTGVPKAAMLTHRNLGAVVHLYSRWLTVPLDPASDRVLGVPPLFHMFGLSLMLLACAAGTALVLPLYFDADECVTSIAEKRITFVAAVPTMFAAIVARARARGCALDSLRYCVTGGAPCPQSTREEFRELTQLELLEGYSMTESPVGVRQPFDRPPEPGTVGLPLPHVVVEVVDLETGERVLPQGETGEICFRGPQVMKGYWRRPEETAAVLRGERLHSGDIGSITSQGFVQLAGRKKDMIVTGGFKVFPDFVERVISRAPNVREVAVVGVPDAYLGQVVKACVVMAPGAQPLTYAQLTDFLQGRLSHYEVPMQLAIMNALPRSPAGKILRADLARPARHGLPS